MYFANLSNFLRVFPCTIIFLKGHIFLFSASQNSCSFSTAILFFATRQCRINHMAEAAYATGPALTLLYFFSEFFCSMFQCETQTVRQCGALKSPSPPENARAPKFKKRGPIKLGPNVFCSLFQCFSAGSQRAQGPQKTSGP